MALNNTQANAINTVARYLLGDIRVAFRSVKADEATEALKTLLDGAHKQLHAGLLPRDAADAIAAVEQLRASVEHLREENDRYHLTDAGHQALNATEESSDASAG